jgi:hypothetical protein
MSRNFYLEIWLDFPQSGFMLKTTVKILIFPYGSSLVCLIL